jgi:hypothetical protein
MSDERPAGEPLASTSANTGAEAASEAVLPSLAALAVAADPTLAAVAALAEPLPPLDGDILGQGDAHAYDGHVALVLDPALLPDMDSTLDLLTSSPDLFDVPALNIGGDWHDATPT